ncbi:MAG: sugar ABC transporter substrate-binding protein [Coleofasciculaceae cyanobacterium SM2_1_6]|nr:sugar ABC transporter substrate-binding protein [Coleofasciculaceae cyanobacterium SM2_1_6]
MLSKNTIAQVGKNIRRLYGVLKTRNKLWWLVLTMAIALAACTLTPEKASQPTTAPNSPSPTISSTQSPAVQLPVSPEIKATRPWKFVIAIRERLIGEGKFANPYWDTVWESAQKAAADFGVEVALLPNPCQTCVTEQITAIDALTRPPKVDGLIIAVADSEALVPVVEKVIAAGTPVIAIDTLLNTDRLLTFMGFDNFAGAKALGEWVANQLKGQGQVAILNGFLDQQNAIGRRNGFLAGLQQGNIEIVATGVANWKTDLAQQLSAEWLTRYPNLKAIVSANDDMALGAIAAAKAAKSSVLITGFDANAEALDAIKNGQMGATISQLMDRQTRLSIQLLIRHLEKKETFPPFVTLSEVSVISKDNISNYR